MNRRITVRVGLPSPGGGLVRYARALGCAVMVSANSFIRRAGPDRDQLHARRVTEQLDEMDVALDSAGFVAMSRYRKSLDPDFYVSHIVQDRRWAFWSAIDLCCEPEVARDPVEVLFRQAETVRLLHACQALAKRHRIPAPMPIAQGFTVADYERFVSMAALHIHAPALVGVGSVCRRPIHGPSGICAVVAALDRVLPPTTRLHLFGVKSDALSALLEVPGLARRIESIDSMAWDAAARRAHPTGRNTALRGEFMRRWYIGQQRTWRSTLRDQDTDLSLPAPRTGLDWRTGDEPLDQWLELLMAGEVDFASATSHYSRACRSTSASITRLLRERGRPRASRTIPPAPGPAQTALDLAA